MQPDFWDMIDRLVRENRLIIDRPKGSAHPRYPAMIYPLDYGYLDGTSSMDGGGIDVWVGSAGQQIDAILCIVDMHKRDSEIKILIGLTEAEKETVVQMMNNGDMRCLLVRRP